MREKLRRGIGEAGNPGQGIARGEGRGMRCAEKRASPSPKRKGRASWDDGAATMTADHAAPADLRRYGLARHAAADAATTEQGETS